MSMNVLNNFVNEIPNHKQKNSAYMKVILCQKVYEKYI